MGSSLVVLLGSNCAVFTEHKALYSPRWWQSSKVERAWVPGLPHGGKLSTNQEHLHSTVDVSETYLVTDVLGCIHYNCCYVSTKYSVVPPSKPLYMLLFMPGGLFHSLTSLRILFHLKQSFLPLPPTTPKTHFLFYYPALFTL